MDIDSEGGWVVGHTSSKCRRRVVGVDNEGGLVRRGRVMGVNNEGGWVGFIHRRRVMGVDNEGGLGTSWASTARVDGLWASTARVDGLWVIRHRK